MLKFDSTNSSKYQNITLTFLNEINLYLKILSSGLDADTQTTIIVLVTCLVVVVVIGLFIGLVCIVKRKKQREKEKPKKIEEKLKAKQLNNNINYFPKHNTKVEIKMKENSHTIDLNTSEIPSNITENKNSSKSLSVVHLMPSMRESGATIAAGRIVELIN